jgi:hypothetical protein
VADGAFLGDVGAAGGIGAGKQSGKLRAASWFLFAASRLLLGARDLKAGLFRLMLLVGDVDDGFCAKEQEQCT